MARDKDIDALFDLVERIAREAERVTLRESPFHLDPCGGCGAPSFQQPCLVCGFYPMGSNKGHWSPKVCSREHFVAHVARSAPEGRGNLATWYVSHYNRQPTPVDWPVALDAGTVFDLVTTGDLAVRRAKSPPEVHAAWSVAGDIRQSLEYRTMKPVHPGIHKRFTEVTKQLVEAAHGDASLWGDVADGLDSIARDIRRHCEATRSGHINAVDRELDVIRAAALANSPSP